MLKCLYIEDNTVCTTLDYEKESDKYRGLIYCLECNRKAWYIKSYTTEKFERVACFAAHHKEECKASTIEIGSDDDDEIESDESKNNSNIRVDLDKNISSSIYISQANEKHDDIESEWQTHRPKKALGNISGFPINKSLKQILTNLCRNKNYAEKGQDISIVADSGRVILNGTLQDNLVKIEEVTKNHIGRLCIFWGTINNLNIDQRGVLWLNYGDYRKEPSIMFTPELTGQLIKNFKLNTVSELDGSDVIIIGHVGFSPNGKAIIRTSFTKYISFRRKYILTSTKN
ncbi:MULTISPECIES: hypothetical protein [Aeromonas]|uniref:hypothetical protein n=1 Tax=Aeromonas TaxID=642 RepID=UPI0009E37085|nr:hypothetical protein [Aeromonas enteropelogenes]UBH56075.1 hypothetical protein LA341_19715 [Aeromonas enteropelogenes]